MLFQSTVLIPTCKMSKESILNTLTRLLLVVVLGLSLLVQSRLWLTVLVAGMVTIGLLYLFNVKGRQGFREDANRDSTDKSRVGFIGTETKKIPRTSSVRLDDVKPTILFRKR